MAFIFLIRGVPTFLGLSLLFIIFRGWFILATMAIGVTWALIWLHRHVNQKKVTS